MNDNICMDEILEELNAKWENMPANEAKDFYSHEIFLIVKIIYKKMG